jgi:hypothetical protein
MKTIFRLSLVLGLFLVLNGEPPKQVEAEVAQPAEVIKAEAPKVVDTTSVTPTPAPEPPKPKPVYPKGCENYRNLIGQYNWNEDVALQVMRAESGCNPNAVGDNRVIGGIYAPSCGLFQVRTLKGRPSCDQLQNPTTNIEWAYRLYQASGWKPWSVCKTKVKCY